MRTEPLPAAAPDLVLTHLDSLPTLAPIAVKLLATTSDRESGAADIIKLIQADQSLTAKILSAAGSSAMGVRGPVNTLEKAVPLLGFSAIRSIVLAVKVFECFATAGGDGTRKGFDRREFWKHALAVACASKRLAAARPDLGIDPEDGFVAGLLHDLGKVALDAVFPKSYDRVAAHADQTRGDIADSERATFGVDHTVAGRRLAERWNLPLSLQETIWLHHLASEALPTSVSAPRLIGLVQLADTIVREQRIGYSGNHAFYEYSPAMAAHLGFTEEHLAAAIQHLVADVSKHAAVLELDRDTPEALYVKAMTSANTELSRLNTELIAKNRRLGAAARFFKAITEFERGLNTWSDLPAVVAAIARASGTALQRPRVAAFGVRHNETIVDFCWTADETAEGGSLSQSVPTDLADWLHDPGDCTGAILVRAPRSVRTALAPALHDLGRGEPWLLPIVHDGRIAGGIVFLSESDERGRLTEEFDDLRSFLASLGFAIGRCNAHAAARRLSDDLAETNRRLQQAQAELLRSRTLSIIAEMAAGAGHELNSPLTVISGRAQMLQQQIDDAGVQRSLETIREKAHECSTIVTDLMDFARPRDPHTAAVDIEILVNEVRQEFVDRLSLPASKFTINVFEEDGAPLPFAQVDRDQIKVVFRELIENALYAVASGDGAITIDCRPAVTADALEVVVRDTGCGMPPAVLQRAFDPFFSSRTAGRRRGLGLPTAHRIVEAHGGRIWLESRPDEGTAAYLILPSAADAGK